MGVSFFDTSMGDEVRSSLKVENPEDPAKVYRQLFGGRVEVRFMEFSQFSVADIMGRLLFELSNCFGDRRVGFLVLDPVDLSPPGFFLEDGWMIEDYQNIISSDFNSKGKAIYYFEVLGFVAYGEAGKWIMYGDRDFDFIAVSVSPSEKGSDGVWPQLGDFPWLSPDEAREVILGNASSDGWGRMIADQLASEISGS